MIYVISHYYYCHYNETITCGEIFIDISLAFGAWNDGADLSTPSAASPLVQQARIKSSVSPPMISRVSGYQARTISRGPCRGALLSEKYNARQRQEDTVEKERQEQHEEEEEEGEEQAGGWGGERVSASARSSVDDCTTFRADGRVSWRVPRNGGRGDSLLFFSPPPSDRPLHPSPGAN